MSSSALALVLTAAFVHALWNLIAKQVPSRLPFVALVAACSVVLWAPPGLASLRLSDVEVGPLAWVLLIGSAVLHVGYFLALQYGYALGDLSLAYPLARGTAPLAATAGAAVALGDRPSITGLVGLALIAGGVVALSLNHSTRGGVTKAISARPVLVALGVGALIATYTVWDAYAIQVALLPPLGFLWLGWIFRADLLCPAC